MLVQVPLPNLMLMIGGDDNQGHDFDGDEDVHRLLLRARS